MYPPNPIAENVPKPILLNVLKHHRMALQELVNDSVEQGASYLPVLTEKLLVLGDNLMDLYLGELTVPEVSEAVLSILDFVRRMVLE